MYKVKLAVTWILLMCFSCQGYTQKVHPTFKKLTYVSYIPITGKDGKTMLLVEHIVTVDSTGKVAAINNSTDGTQYYKIKTDTVFRMPDSLLVQLNALFEANRKIISFKKYDKDPAGGQFAGPLNFLSYTNEKGLTDNAVVVNGLFDVKFQKTLNKLWRLPHPRIKRYNQIYIDKQLEMEILKCQRAATYIPSIVQPPAEKISSGKK